MNILLIDNDFKTAMEVKKLIEKMGHKVGFVAKNYNEAMLSLDELIPHLIIADLELEGNLDGLSAVRDIEEEYQVPIIFYSSIFGKDVLDKIKKLPVINFIVKARPNKLEEVQIAIELADLKIKSYD